MYICCGKLCWEDSDPGAGPYKGKPPHDEQLSYADDEEWLEGVIIERLQALDAVEHLLQGWQTRAQREGPESAGRLEYSQAIIPAARQFFQSLEGEEREQEEKEDKERDCQALRLRIIERRLRSIEFCDGCSEADRREFVQEVDRVFATLQPSMGQIHQNNVCASADEKAPALRHCFKAISKELSAIDTTIMRRVVLDYGDKWDDVPEETQHTCKQPADSEEFGMEDGWCTRAANCLLETAIFRGYSGYEGPSAGSTTQTTHDTSRLAEPGPSKRSAGTVSQRPCRKVKHEAKQVGPSSWVW